MNDPHFYAEQIGDDPHDWQCMVLKEGTRLHLTHGTQARCTALAANLNECISKHKRMLAYLSRIAGGTGLPGEPELRGTPVQPDGAFTTRRKNSALDRTTKE